MGAIFKSRLQLVDIALVAGASDFAAYLFSASGIFQYWRGTQLLMRQLASKTTNARRLAC